MKPLFLISILFLTICSASAASLYLVETKPISSGYETFDVMLDPGSSSINAFSGTVSVPGSYVDIASISTADSLATLWLAPPQVSKELKLDDRKRISFEGIFPGGFDGVRSPYYAGMKPGKLFSVTVKPVQEGHALILLENIDVRANDGAATKVPVDVNQLEIQVPAISSLPVQTAKAPIPKEVTSSVQTYISRSAETSNKWVLLIYDETVGTTPLAYSIAESSEADPRAIPSYEWQSYATPYLLLHQTRNVFVHVKAEYADGSYSFTTIAPVENEGTGDVMWRILLLIALLAGSFYVLKATRTKEKEF